MRKHTQENCERATFSPRREPKTAIKNRAVRIIKNKPRKVKRNLEAPMPYLGKFLQELWKATLTSNLRPRDKAEVLRLLIFAVTVVIITALFVLNHL